MGNDLATFIALLAERGELRRVAAEVDPELEIAAITTRVGRQAGGGPALLFERVRGHRYPVATNLFGSSWRAARAWGVDDMVLAHARLSRALAKAPGQSAAQRLAALLAAGAAPSPAAHLCLPQVPADLAQLPALRNWPGDGGRFLTLPLVVTRHPETGAVNIGIYRMQILDRQRAALHFLPGADGGRHLEAWRRRGEPMPVAVALGGDPALLAAAALPLPAGIGEVEFARFLRGEPLAMAVAPRSGLPVPAAAEFLLEGTVAPEDLALEGPFGNHTGFYRPAAPAPVLRLDALHAGASAVFPATVVGPPPTENVYLAKANERLILALLQGDHPEIVDLSYFAEGIFHGCAVVAVKKEETGAVGEWVRRLWQDGPLRRSRLLVVVDAEDWPLSPSQLLWQVFNRTLPQRDILVDEGRMAVDATEKTGWPRLESDPGTEARIERRWGELGLDP